MSADLFWLDAKKIQRGIYVYFLFYILKFSYIYINQIPGSG